MIKLVFLIYTATLVAAQQKLYEQCGGGAYFGSTKCDTGLQCYKKDQWYSQCLTSCPSGWECASNAASSGNKGEEVQLYGQCGGGAYTGPTTCAAGLQCYKKDQWYSQCLTSCPSDWECAGSVTSQTTQGSSAATQSTTQGSTGTLTNGKFPNCQFRFGMAFDGAARDYSVADYLTIWIGSPSSTHGTNFNPYWHGEMVKTAIRYNKLVVYYGYIIAFMARDEWGLKDCDVGSPSLCEKGADYIRANRAAIIAKYKHYAAETAALTGRNAETIWLIEPDFWQYYGDVSHQQNGVLSGAYMRQLFDDIAIAVKSELPNARLSWDISAWIGESGMLTWWGYFASSPHIDYIHTSGGQSRADLPNIKPNEIRWGFMSTLTGKRIIADTGYGVAGGSTGHNYAYDDINNLRARILDGVISVSQANPKSDWGNTLTTLRSQLPKLC